jgi:hypothetical protein
MLPGIVQTVLCVWYVVAFATCLVRMWCRLAASLSSSRFCVSGFDALTDFIYDCRPLLLRLDFSNERLNAISLRRPPEGRAKKPMELGVGHSSAVPLQGRGARKCLVAR